MRILITGATSTVSRGMIPLLKEAGHEIVLHDNVRAPDSELFRDIAYVQGDIQAGVGLGRALAPALEAQGHRLRLMDFRPMNTPHEFVLGDVRSAEDVRRAIEGIDAIVHAAALHGIHLSKWSPDDFWDINGAGTFHVYEAARQEGVSRVVLCSTMGVYGKSAKPPEDAWNAVA